MAEKKRVLGDRVIRSYCVSVNEEVFQGIPAPG
jgi:hypothetical protein